MFGAGGSTPKGKGADGKDLNSSEEAEREQSQTVKPTQELPEGVAVQQQVPVKSAPKQVLMTNTETVIQTNEVTKPPEKKDEEEERKEEVENKSTSPSAAVRAEEEANSAQESQEEEEDELDAGDHIQ
ncbi:hypothetical protein J437_LFUL010614, partial [Ladona fulva]